LCQDLEISDGNFLVSSLKQLCLHTSQAEGLQEAASTFQTLLANRFPNSFAANDFTQEMDERGASDDHDDDYSEDGPVVVAGDEVEASLARSSAASSLRVSSFSQEILQAYPLLVAAIMPHEDILMTCARALDEAVDVSLVREAASYLEQMEQQYVSE
jgi:A1 cistron-splicing factor AAR2